MDSATALATNAEINLHIQLLSLTKHDRLLRCYFLSHSHSSALDTQHTISMAMGTGVMAAVASAHFATSFSHFSRMSTWTFDKSHFIILICGLE